MQLTADERKALTVLHGGATECQEAQTRLFAAGYRWCVACRSVLPVQYFGRRANMNHGRESRCRSCHKERRTRKFVKLTGPTRTARFFRRNPEARPEPTRGPYVKTRESRAAGEYIADPIRRDLWLAGRSPGDCA